MVRAPLASARSPKPRRADQNAVRQRAEQKRCREPRIPGFKAVLTPRASSDGVVRCDRVGVGDHRNTGFLKYSGYCRAPRILRRRVLKERRLLSDRRTRFLKLMLGWKDGGRARWAKPLSCPVWSRRMGPRAWADRRNPYGEAGVRLSAFTRASSGAEPPRCRSASIAATCGSQYSA
jgi:hypothetical protein